MGAYDNWCAQKQKLRQSIQDATDMSGMVYAVRHTLAQVEQTTMAQQQDDLLRQQTGILFSCCKNSVGLLDVSISTKVWVPQSYKKPQKNPLPLLLWIVAGLVQAAGGVYGYITGQWTAWIPMAAAFVAAAVALPLTVRTRKKEAPTDQVRVTLQPDEDKLFRMIDAQTQAIDRYINDFAYLNGQALGQDNAPDGKMIARIADMLEALYECDEAGREPAENATNRMLEGMGLEALAYSEGNQHLFTTLPSKDGVHTLVPALVAQRDRRLLRRGVAAVQREEAAAE